MKGEIGATQGAITANPGWGPASMREAELLLQVGDWSY